MPSKTSMTGTSLSSLWRAKTKEKDVDINKDKSGESFSSREKPPASFRLPIHGRSVSTLHLPAPPQDRGRGRDRDRDRDSGDASRKSRRLSMNDAAQCLPLIPNRLNKPLVPIPPSASKGSLFDFGRTSRAQSRAQSPVKEESSKGSSVVGHPNGAGVGTGTAGFLRSAFSTRKWKDVYHDSDDGAVFDDDDYHGFRRPDDAFQKPIISFRGGHSWKFLEKDRDNLYLDLFWPVTTTKEDEEEEDTSYMRQKHDVLPIEEMTPLCNFRQLRFLRLTGMSQSYQKYIWLTVWLNPALEKLHLEMALEPCIRRTFHASWPSIKGDWTYRPADRGHDVYYGDNGQGTLHRRVGIGEYLDKYAIETARNQASEMGASLRYLPIVELSLTGFVVDSDPFFIFFHPHRLRIIELKNDCVDAGFLLPSHMHEQVIVGWPQTTNEHQAVQISAVKRRDVKLIDLGHGMSSAGKKDGLMSKVTMSRFVEEFETKDEEMRKAAAREEALEQLESNKKLEREREKETRKRKKPYGNRASRRFSGEEGSLLAAYNGTGVCPPGYI